MGGAEVFTWEIAARLVRQGHNVVLFTSEFPGCKKEEYADEVKIVRAGSRYNVHRQAKQFYETTSAKSRFDVIIDGINTRPFFAPSFARHDEKIIPIIFQLAREYWLYETPLPIGLIGYLFLERIWLRRYKALPTATISRSTQVDLMHMGFEHIFTIPVGTNVPPRSELPTKELHPIIVFDGRLGRAKRPDHALRAFALVKRIVDDAELWIIGNGPMRKRLQDHSQEGVRFFDTAEHVERIKLVERAWMLVNPSIREGFGLNVINANAVGTPAVGYDVPGLRDSILDHSTGLLVKNGDINQLANALITLIRDRNLRTLLSTNALQHSKHFSWDESARRFSNMLAS